MARQRKSPKPPAFDEVEKLREWERIQAGLARLRDRLARLTGEAVTCNTEINALWMDIDNHFSAQQARDVANPPPNPPSPAS